MTDPLLPTTAASLLAQQQALSSFPTLTFPPISSILPRGLPRGRITAITGSAKTGKSLLAHHAILAFLLDPTNGSDLVAVIDPGEVKREFVIEMLVQMLEGRVGRARVGEFLDRVLVIKTYDYRGAMDALAELRQRLEATAVRRSIPVPTEGRREQASERQAPIASPSGPKEPRKRRMIIQDSDPENSQSSSPSSCSSSSSNEVPAPAPAPHPPPSQPQDLLIPSPPPKISLLILETISQTLLPRLSPTHPLTSQSHLATLMRTLALLTRTYALTTLVLNSAVTPPPCSNLQHSAATAAADGGDMDLNPDPESHPSIFAAVRARPALGRGFAHFVDLSLMLGRVPRRRADVRRSKSGSGDGEEVGVLEALSDRGGWSERGQGTWTWFEVRGLEFEELG